MTTYPPDVPPTGPTLVYDGGEGAAQGQWDIITTERGVYRAQYFGGTYGEVTKVWGPQLGEPKAFHTPGNLLTRLRVQGGRLVIEYVRFPGDGSKRRPVWSVNTGMWVGMVVGATQTSVTGPAGPGGPEGPKGDPGSPGTTTTKVVHDMIDQQSIDAIAHAVNTFPAAADHFGIPLPEAQSGLWSQDAITVLLSNQAVMQLVHKASDEANALTGRTSELQRQLAELTDAVEALTLRITALVEGEDNATAVRT